MQRHSLSPIGFIHHMVRHRSMLRQLIYRDVMSRYQGSALGFVWAFAVPLMMLVVYSFVFGVIFQARFGNETAQTSDVNFALTLFCGLLVHGFCAECLTRAPLLMVQHPSYVKKIIFPLELLPVMMISSTAVHLVINITVLLIGIIATTHMLPWTMIYLPLILIPMMLFMVGISWFLASLGVFMRDIGQITGLCSTLLLFLSPVFYPIERLPAHYQPFMRLNPLTPTIEAVRAVLLEGRTPDMTLLSIYMVVSLVVAWGGYAWFQRTRSAFADVL
ncbi:MAG: ABC transporter permease [Alphaproteobacteria bacterium]|nr:MAG: ABC transporter permease [Alphaproteobacteria bacterium]TAF75297.1 MAG: ABC transporter permease [Alphaproteobacteria bacterium]